MAKLPGYWQVQSTTNEDMVHVLDRLYWNDETQKVMATRTSKLVEEAKELHEAMLEMEFDKADLDALNELMWEMSDVFAVYRHLEMITLDYIGLTPDMLSWLEQKLAGMAVLKAEKRAEDPSWGRDKDK